MIEKFVSGAIAILTWYFTYCYWYTMPWTVPDLPGDGLFKYKDVRQPKEQAKRRGTTTLPQSIVRGQLPTFMGMPLYGLRNLENKEQKDEDTDIETDAQTTVSSK
jgi:hypothetical protein